MLAVPILYSFRRCPFAIRARLALDASLQRCELREVVLRDKPEEMLRASAKGTVPVLIDEHNAVIDESLDIMLWALRRDDPERWLDPERDDLKAMLKLIEVFDSKFKFDLDRYKYPLRFVDVDPIQSRERAGEHLKMLEGRLSQVRFLFGNQAALADMAIMPFVRQFANVAPAWFDEQAWPELKRWLKSISDSARFVRIMRPLEPWVAGTRGVPFPFSLIEHAQGS